MVTSICVLCEAGDKNALTERSVSAAAEKRKKAARENMWEPSRILIFFNSTIFETDSDYNRFCGYARTFCARPPLPLATRTLESELRPLPRPRHGPRRNPEMLDKPRPSRC